MQTWEQKGTDRSLAFASSGQMSHPFDSACWPRARARAHAAPMPWSHARGHVCRGSLMTSTRGVGKHGPEVRGGGRPESLAGQGLAELGSGATGSARDHAVQLRRIKQCPWSRVLSKSELCEPHISGRSEFGVRTLSGPGFKLRWGPCHELAPRAYPTGAATLNGCCSFGNSTLRQEVRVRTHGGVQRARELARMGGGARPTPKVLG